MLDISRMQRIRLSAHPRGQIAVALGILAPSYEIYPGVEIEFEGFEKVPREPVIFVMNHTDRYNYFPFQYRLYRQHARFTATWVKGKYYENAVVSSFMEHTSNIPTVSRGYIITKDFLSVMGRRPEADEYAALRAMLNALGKSDSEEVDAGGVPRPVFERARNILGRPFAPQDETWAEAVDAVFRSMMRRFVELNEETFELGLSLLVFPEGTRTKRLAKGHPGIAQIALRHSRTIVPIGCNGSDLVHPGSSPLPRAGRIVYRFGDPVRLDASSPFHIEEEYEPFTAEAETRHGATFQALVDDLMLRINELVDPEYQFADAHESEGVSGTGRFV
ncbi:MAG: hypothetical protein GXP55_04770 [Deltaproteobacteria bacterium]|nr:hypothetical protein [Deltaproteobacteria bacterium]